MYATYDSNHVRAAHERVQHIHNRRRRHEAKSTSFVLERVRLPLPSQAQAPPPECPRHNERPIEEQPPRVGAAGRERDGIHKHIKRSQHETTLQTQTGNNTKTTT